MIDMHQAEAVVHLTINRPAKKNALTREMYGLLSRHIRAAADDKTVNAIVISGHGDVFTAGIFGEVMDGVEARACGLANKVVDDGTAVTAALELAQRLAGKPREALRASKRLIRAPWRDQVREALERERSVFSERLRSHDCRQALARLQRR